MYDRGDKNNINKTTGECETLHSPVCLMSLKHDFLMNFSCAVDPLIGRTSVLESPCLWASRKAGSGGHTPTKKQREHRRFKHPQMWFVWSGLHPHSGWRSKPESFCFHSLVFLCCLLDIWSSSNPNPNPNSRMEFMREILEMCLNLPWKWLKGSFRQISKQQSERKLKCGASVWPLVDVSPESNKKTHVTEQLVHHLQACGINNLEDLRGQYRLKVAPVGRCQGG